MKHFPAQVCLTATLLMAGAAGHAFADSPPKVFTTWEQMYLQVPENLRPAEAKTMNKVQIEVVNKSLAENVDGKDALLDGYVQDGVITPKGKYKGRPRINCQDEIVSGVDVLITFNFEDTDAGKAAVAQADKGEYIQVAGKVGTCYFRIVNKKMFFIVDVDKCEIKVLGKK